MQGQFENKNTVLIGNYVVIFYCFIKLLTLSSKISKLQAIQKERLAVFAWVYFFIELNIVSAIASAVSSSFSSKTLLSLTFVMKPTSRSKDGISVSEFI